MQKLQHTMENEVIGSAKTHRNLTNHSGPGVEDMKKDKIDFEKAFFTHGRQLYRKATSTTRTIGVALNLIELPKKEDVVSQAKTIFQHYVYVRLKKEKLLSSKVLHLGSYGKPSDVASEIVYVGSELEKMYPELYSSVVNQIKLSYLDENVVRKSFHTLAEDLCKTKTTWGRVVALISLGGALAQDCCKKGQSELVSCIVDTFVKFTQRHLAAWIIKQGGWSAVLKAFTYTESVPGFWTVSFLVATAGFLATVPILIEL